MEWRIKWCISWLWKKRHWRLAVKQVVGQHPQTRCTGVLRADGYTGVLRADRRTGVLSADRCGRSRQRRAVVGACRGTREGGRYLPGDVGLPAPPGFAEVLQDGAGLVLLDPLRHHVQDVVHDGRAQLQVKVRLHALLGDRLGHALRVATCEERRRFDTVLFYGCPSPNTATKTLYKVTDASEKKEHTSLVPLK